MHAKCYRNGFTQAEYEKYENFGWYLPAAWGERTSGFPLAALYSGAPWKGRPSAAPGGSGVFSILPMLGMAAGLKSRDRTTVSVEKLGQLGGINPRTVSKAIQALKARKLVSSRLTRAFGMPVTTFSVSPELSAAASLRDDWKEYFYFPMRLLFGGNWSTLTKPQQALYLGAATVAKTSTDAPDENPLLCEVLRDGQRLRDLTRAWLHVTDFRYTGRLRLACVSHNELSTITGLHPDTLQSAAAALRWSPDLSTHCPLAVYPTNDGQALLYHFRDHCVPLFGRE